MKKHIFHTFSFSCLFLLAGLMLTGCGDKRVEKEEDKVQDQVETASYNYTPLDAFLELDSKVEDSLRDWDAFWELQKEMETFRSRNSGDLNFTTEELLRLQGELMHDSIPERVKVPAVRSRSLVFQTFTSKLKDQLSHGAPVPEIDSSRIKIVESYNAFRYQIADALREKVYEDFLERDTTRRDSLASPVEQ